MGTVLIFLPFHVAYDSLKDFYDIYEVAALKWKVRAPVRLEREWADGSMGGQGREVPGGPAPSCSKSSALGLALALQG